ncbi:hypothetical protein N9D31_02840 [Oligoflexaceae bacterium]|nr:hypothetical protein [Oligoflexaceae bacterium]
MSDDKKVKEVLECSYEPLMQEGHKLRSRRDLFAQGVYSLGAYVVLPSISTLALEKMAYGECKSNDSASKGLAGMMCFDIAGGWNAAGNNVMVGMNDSQTNFIPDYSTLGLPAALHPDQVSLNEEFGLRFHPNSGFLAGLLEVTSATTRAKVDGAVFTCISGDDTANNPHSPVFAIAKAAERGKLVNIVGSNSNNVSGSRAQSPSELIDPANRAVTISNDSSASSLVQLGKLTSEIFNGQNDSAELVMKKIKELSNSRLAKFNNTDMPKQLKELVDCGYIEAGGYLKKFDPAALNPLADNMVVGPNQTGVFKDSIANAVNYGTSGNISMNELRRVRTMAKMVIDGLCSVSTTIMGGYDYHQRDRSETDAKDYRVGKSVGASLELAARKGQDLIVYIYSDGAVSCDANVSDTSALGVRKFRTRSDSGTRSVAFMLVYGANGRPEIRNEGRQVGSFNSSGGVDRAFNLITNSPENLTKAVVANYLALHGKEDKLKDYIGTDPFGKDLDKYLVFGKFKAS